MDRYSIVQRSQSMPRACPVERHVRCYLATSMRLLRNSSKKPLFFDILRVSFRYLLVEDKQRCSTGRARGIFNHDALHVAGEQMRQGLKPWALASAAVVKPTRFLREMVSTQ